MDVFQAINKRRSVRSFSTEPIAADLVQKLIAAAMQAPSAGNQQPWRFIVVTDRAKLEQIPKFHPYCKMVTQASTAIVVCGDPRGKKWPDLWPQDCSAAVQNLLLAAVAQGIGAVWTGVYPFEERMAGCRELLSIPEEVYPFAIVPLGYPKNPEQAFSEKDRFNGELIHREVF